MTRAAATSPPGAPSREAYAAEAMGSRRPPDSASISLIQPVDLYSRVNRATKYGFLFIGFTFLALLMFDIIGGVRVSAVEYLLMGAAIVLFFVLLLAFAEVIGFTAAYVVASAAIAGLNTAYSAAVLGSWKRGLCHRRAADRPLCGALHPARARGLLAADRLACCCSWRWPG